MPCENVKVFKYFVSLKSGNSSHQQFLCVSSLLIQYHICLSVWLIAPEGTTTVNLTSAADWEMAVRRYNVININNATFLNQIRYLSIK